MMARRSLSREKLGTLVLTVTVLASLASMDSKGWKNGDNVAEAAPAE